MKSRIAIIPARAGSKRIQNKNIKSFLGKPIIAYSIEAALNSELFDKVMVSTDSTKIAEISKSYGASVPFLRSATNSSDFATTYDVLVEVLSQLKQAGQTFEQACCIYATAPFVNKSLLEECFNRLTEGYDCVFPIVAFDFPIQRAVKIQSGGKVDFADPSKKNIRSQDLEPMYHDTGQFYWFNTEAILKKEALVTDNSSAVIINAMDVQDIDTETDWKLAEMKYQLLQRGY